MTPLHIVRTLCTLPGSSPVCFFACRLKSGGEHLDVHRGEGDGQRTRNCPSMFWTPCRCHCSTVRLNLGYETLKELLERVLSLDDRILELFGPGAV